MVKMKKNTLLVAILLLGKILIAQTGSVINFNAGWKFYLGNDSTASKNGFTDADWKLVTLPHDWSIELPFDQKAAATTQGGALPGGIGWYRKSFTLPSSTKDKNITIEFDGIYRNSEVWINGHYLGKRPNGYISFQYDLTPYIKFGTVRNIIAVKVDNSQQPNSRWYTGSGIYRNVRLVTKNKISFDLVGNYIVPSVFSMDKNKGIVFFDSGVGSTFGSVHIVSLPMHNHTLDSVTVRLVTEVYDANGKKVFECKARNISMAAYSSISIGVDSTDGGSGFKDPILWSTNHPYLYKVVSSIYKNNLLLDKVVTPVGFRQFNFDSEKGFFLNKIPLKIKGVCLHHDLGALGAAFNIAAARRQLLILKKMGCNAIRTSHNPVAPELLDLCDQMGFLVMEEAFDMWQKKKNKFDYSLDFKQWHKRDLEDMILRDRNHPSIFMWSIGNEIREQFDSSGIFITKELVSIVKKLDPTRPVTSAITETDTAKNFIYQSNALDVLGWNYNHLMYPDFLKKYPGKKFIAAETNSAIATRGHYDMPSDSVRTWPAKGQKETTEGNPDLTVSAYDNAKAYWGSTHEETWKIIKKYDFLSGLFVWSGFDYLGEPTPYPWPARSSYFGIIDLAGFPKDVYYLYQSEWTNQPVLHLFPHWNWPADKVVDVWAYYNNADEVELFLNGKSLGVRKKMGDQLHVMWRINYQPGTLLAISRKDGKQVLSTEIKTAGKVASIRMLADRNVLIANGEDLSFVTIQLLDAAGNIVPTADNLVELKVKGNGSISGMDNGSPTSLESFQSPFHKAFNGLCLAIIKGGNQPGKIIVEATSKGIRSNSVSIRVK